MFIRSYKQKEVMVISDHPLIKEQERDVYYSEQSQIKFKDCLNTASLKQCKNSENKHLLNSSTICYTYLFPKRYEKSDFDFTYTITQKKNRAENYSYVQVEHLKDIWLEYTLYEEFNNLLRQIREVNPKLIIITGKWAFFLLCVRAENPELQLTTIGRVKSKPTDIKYFGELSTFRSSCLTLFSQFNLPKTLCIPILTPAYHFIVTEKAHAIQLDYNKIARIHKSIQEKTYTIDYYLGNNFRNEIGDTKEKIISYLTQLLHELDQKEILVAFDVETRQKDIDCIGIAYEENRSLTIPFSYIEYKEDSIGNIKGYKLDKDKKLIPHISKIGDKLEIPRQYWNIKDEIEIMEVLSKVMLHPNCLHVGQNYLYDTQWYHHIWKFLINGSHDTMTLHHVLYNYMQKDLAFLASMYIDNYTYWKDDLNISDNEIRWRYNGKDCCYTLKLIYILLKILSIQPKKLQEFYKFQQEETTPLAMTMMNRGVKVDQEVKERLKKQFYQLQKQCEEKLNYVFNEEVNMQSNTQVRRAFKMLLGIKPKLHRKTKRESFGADAMLQYLEEYPEWRAILTLFLEYKSIKVFVKNFLSAEVDYDGKMRCAYGVAGTKSYRFNSKKNIFGSGMNMANIPSHGKIDLSYVLQEIEQEEEIDE